MNDTVDVDIECDFDLRNATACRCDSIQVEAAKTLIIGSHFTLAL